MMQKDKKIIAFVCTGNTCRSPMAEAIFNKLAEENGINAVAESFGIATQTGLPVSENSIEALKEIGIDISKMTSTAVSDVNLSEIDRFYCMSASHMAILQAYFGISADKISVLNVSDPYGGDIGVYRACRDEIHNSVKEIIEAYED